jgi:hypothetical protein
MNIKECAVLQTKESTRQERQKKFESVKLYEERKNGIVEKVDESRLRRPS